VCVPVRCVGRITLEALEVHLKNLRWPANKLGNLDRKKISGTPKW